MSGGVHQATAVSLGGRAILVEGPPGSGKSSLALLLIDRGAQLVGDDGVLLELRGGAVWALPHPATAGLLEIRNVGLVTYPCGPAPIALVIALAEDAPRFIEAPERATRGGAAVPLIRLWPHTPALALRAEMALHRYGRSGTGG